MPLLGVRPVRLGLVGAARIGTRRLQALREYALGEVVAVADEDPLVRASTEAPWGFAGRSAPRRYADAEALLAGCRDELDAVILALPPEQQVHLAAECLERGVAVYCVASLPWTREHIVPLIEVARRSNRRLGLDYRFRGLSGIQIMRDACTGGSLGELMLLELIYHEHRAPDGPAPAGGVSPLAGSIARLGAHLVDLLGYILPTDRVQDVLAVRYAAGAVLSAGSSPPVDDFTVATMRLASGTTVQLTCSSGGHPGRGTDLQVRCHGTRGGLHLHNQNGHTTHFELARLQGNVRQVIAVMDARWTVRAMLHWLDAVADTVAFDADDATSLLRTAVILEAMTGQ